MRERSRTEEAEPAVPLTGGRVTDGVVRVGDTVRRPLTERSPFVHELLRHLERVGFDGAPRVGGTDEQGREVLAYVDGWVPPNLDVFPDETLAAAAELLRRFHDATEGTPLAGPHEVVCHNDPSPCNHVLVGGLPVALIDFDAAAPGTRVSDLAYAAWLWTIASDNGLSVREQARKARVMAQAYGHRDVAGLFDAILRRQEENLAATVRDARSSVPSRAGYAVASARWQRGQMAWLRANAAAFRAALDG